jgi:hypothetical protein
VASALVKGGSKYSRFWYVNFECPASEFPVVEGELKDQAMMRPGTLEELIRQYVNTRRDPAISVSAATRALKAIMPECPLDGRALDNAIARGALAEGYAVVFDRSPDCVPATFTPTGNAA